MWDFVVFLKVNFIILVDWQISSQREKSGNYKSGLSAGINGTGFTGQATMQDTVDSQIEGATARSVLPERYDLFTVDSEIENTHTI